MASLASLRLARLPSSPLTRRLLSTSAPVLSNQNLKKHESGFHAQSSTTVLPNQPVSTFFPNADATKTPNPIADAPLTATATILKAIGEDSDLPDLSGYKPRGPAGRGAPPALNSGINTADGEEKIAVRSGTDVMVLNQTTYGVYDPYEARRLAGKQSNIPPWMRGFSLNERVRSEDIEVTVLDSDQDYEVNRVAFSDMMRFLPENPGTQLGLAVALDRVEKRLVKDISKLPLYDPDYEMGRVRWNEARSKAADEAVRGQYRGAAKQQGMLGSLERTLGVNRTVSAESRARMVARVNVVASKLGVDAVPQLQAPKKGKRRAVKLGKGTIRKAKALAKKAIDKKKVEGDRKKGALVVKAQSLTQRKK